MQWANHMSCFNKSTVELDQQQAQLHTINPSHLIRDVLIGNKNIYLIIKYSS